MFQREELSGGMDGECGSLLRSQPYWYNGDWFGVVLSSPDEMNPSRTKSPSFEPFMVTVLDG